LKEFISPTKGTSVVSKRANLTTDGIFTTLNNIDLDMSATQSTLSTNAAPTPPPAAPPRASRTKTAPAVGN
jgi:hypothetical protein